MCVLFVLCLLHLLFFFFFFLAAVLPFSESSLLLLLFFWFDAFLRPSLKLVLVAPSDKLWKISIDLRI